MYTHRRSKVTCILKITFVECPPISGKRGSIGYLNQLPRNTQRVFFFFLNACQKMQGGKLVIVKKRRQKDILHFRATAQKKKKDFKVHRDPPDHWNVKRWIRSHAISSYILPINRIFCFAYHFVFNCHFFGVFNYLCHSSITFYLLPIS